MNRPAQRLAAISYLVADYDAAITWFTQILGFELVSDTDQGGGKRWVEVQAEPSGVKLLMAQARGDTQIAAIGKAAGGRVGFFLHTDDLETRRAEMETAGVIFLEATRHEPYGKVAVFEDLYGNKWDLLEPKL